jgi:asparagine synthase (glutamine-hydrolysing)
MCGIVGIAYRAQAQSVDRELIERLKATMAHRGPDGEGTWVAGNMGLGFRRLAIIDIQHGAQPMLNEDNTIALVLNGEIYNHGELRSRLEQLGHRFLSRSDAETVLHGYEQWGRDVVHELRGMFAFAVMDMKTHTLFAARDRFGEKPFFYTRVRAGQADEALAFSSELRTLIAHPQVARDLDPAAVSDYLTYAFVPDPRTILKDVHKLPPAHWLEWRDGELKTSRYWELSYTPKRAIGISQAAEEVREAIREAVAVRLQSEVPLGFFLSSGIDSTSILAFGSESISAPTTFSAAVKGDPQGELDASQELAETFHAAHHDLLIIPDVAAELPALVRSLDEPIAKKSSLAYLHLFRFTAGTVKVVLSGEGVMRSSPATADILSMCPAMTACPSRVLHPWNRCVVLQPII